MPATATIELADLSAHEGQTLGPTAWRTITQDDVDAFARLTGDDQWIHVDRERAASGPFGTTIAHGYFTLSLSTIFLDEVVKVTGADVVLNYGSDRVRYPAPTPAGAKVRAAVDLVEVRPLDGGAQAIWRLTYEVDGGRKPVCVADIVYRYYTELPARPPEGSSRARVG
ncbi:MAG: MaoC family dehydratase [Acidimicrobiales bacterium]